jgi:hypothetical protein
MDGTNTITGYRVQITGTNDTDQRVYMGTSTASAFVLGTNGTQRLRIDGSTGAATFSSSVTGNRYIINGINGNAGQIIQQGDLLGTAGTNLLLQSSSGNAIGFLTNGGTTFNMFINTSGNVGIGTTTPQATLDVESRGSSDVFRIGPFEGTAYGIHQYYDASSGSVYFDQRYDNNAGNIYFRTKTTGTPINAFTILGSGNVGIGTASPNAKLQIEGNDLIMNTENSYQSKSMYFRYSNGATILSDSDLRFSTGAPSEKMRIFSNGEVNIGYGATDNGASLLQVNGSIYAAGTIYASDERYKENIIPLNKGLDLINKLKPVTFNYINTTENNFSEFEEIGFIAQDVDRALSTESFVKSIVKYTDESNTDSKMVFSPQNLIPILTKAIQEQNALIKALEQRIINLENK